MLRKELVPVVFGQGVKTKNDAKTQLLGTFRSAKNIIFETLNLFKKRNGYDAINLVTASNVTLTAVDYLFKFKNELLAVDSDTLYGYSKALNQAVQRGPIFSAVPTSNSIFNNGLNHDIADVCVAEDMAVYTFRESATGNAKYSVKDLKTGTFVVTNASVAACDLVKTAVVNNTVYFVYNVAGNLYYREMNIFQPSILAAQVQIANNVETSKVIFDVAEATDRFFVAYNSTVVGNRVVVLSVDTSGNISAGLGIPGSPDSKCISLQKTALNRVFVAYASTTTVYYAVVSYTAAAVLLAQTTIEAIANVKNVDLQNYDGSTLQLVYEIGATDAYNHYLKKCSIDSVGTVGTPQVFKRGLGLASEGFLKDGKWFTVAVYPGTIQSTIFVLDESANVVAKALVGTAQGLNTKGSLPHTHLNTVDTAVQIIPALVKTKLVAENGTFFSNLGVTEIALDFDLNYPYQNAFFGNNLHIAGGFLQMYDGANVVEHGFHVFPEAPVVSATPTTGGNMADGNYGVLLLYKWIDNVGQDHFSVPSTSINVVLTGGTSTQQIDITAPTLRLTRKSNVVIQLYRTEDNGTTFYLAGSVANNTAVDSVTVSTGLSDANLISQELLYTTGGILENTAAPSASVVGVHTAANRVVVVSENKNQIVYSKIREDGKPVEFNDALLKDIDPVGGPITAVASMDEKLIIFAEQAIFYISGSGPNNAGEQDSYTDPERVSIDVGCVNPNSIVLTPDGLMFESKKGVYLLNRALGTEYIGADVEAYNTLNISSAKLIPNQNQVRFTTSDGECLVYNYFTKTWATYSNHRATSAEVVDNTYYYSRTDGQLFAETEGEYADDTSTVSLDMETGWINVGSLQGYQRVYKMMILGNYKSPHKLQIQIAYDYNNALVQDVVINPLDFLDGAAYGDESPYGSGTPYGGTGNVYQARVDFKIQKCQAFKLRITELQDNPGPGVELNGFTLQVGVKRGTNKVGVSRKFSTT